MKKILLSLAMISLVMATSIGATKAYFSDTASITDNTFSTGVLEIRVNGEPTVLGATFDKAVPGEDYVSEVYGMQNYGLPWFGGPSNVDAKKLILNVTNPNDFGSGLWDLLVVKVEVGRLSGVMERTVYQGLLKDLHDVDLFAGGYWTSLIPGSSEDLKYTVALPETGSDQSSLMGKTLTWDFVIEGRSN